MTTDPNTAAKRTVVSMVPPAPAAAAPTMPLHHGPGPMAPTVPNSRDFQQTRHEHMHLAGTEGLSEPASDQPRIRLTPGKVVPGTRYRILRWLGEGGMGVVYEAEHIDIERRVAMKILRFDLSQQDRMATVFRDEARAASRIGSKQIVEIYDFGELQDGRLFFCMELLSGGDLVPDTEDEWVRPPRLIALLRQVAKGLGAAHRAGIVHRDIKPENIIVVDTERPDTVKLVDFGISTMLAAGKGEGASIAGTPHYMAPEQISGEAFDGRLDMYAIGCMAYELLVGHPPFDADELEELLRMQMSATPPPIKQVRPDREIPDSLIQVIMKCLEKDPANRYRDMADLEAALCEAQIAAGISTAWDDLELPDVEPDRRERLLRDMPSPLVDLEQPGRKWTWPVVAALAVLIAVGAVAFALLRPPPAPTEQEKDAIEELTIAARNAAARTHYVYPPIEDPEAPTAYRKVLELESMEGNAAEHGNQRASELRTEFATALTAMGDQFWEDEAARRFARQFYLMAMLFDENAKVAKERAGVTLGEFAEFRALAASGDFTAAELAAAQWLEVLAEEDDSARQEKFDSLLAAEDSDRSVFADTMGVRAARSAGVKVGERPDAEDPDEAADTGGEVADTDGEVSDTDGEVEELETASSKGTKKGVRTSGKKATEKLGGSKSDPAKSDDLAAEGKAALSAGKRKEAEKLFNQAVAYNRKNAKALMGLSDVYFDTGSNQKAVIYAEKAVQASPKNSTYRLKLGDAYYKVLRYRDAKEQYEKAKDLGSSKADSRLSKVNAKLGG